MKIPEKNLTKFRCLWKRDTGEELPRAEAIEEFYKLISFVEAGAKIAALFDDKKDK